MFAQMVDANQAWSVDEAIEWMKKLAPLKPMWIEEPTSPDDVLGHAVIARALECVIIYNKLPYIAVQLRYSFDLVNNLH